MGAWAHGNFDNDDALDWASTLTGSQGALSGLDAISEALESVLNSGNDIESFNAASALAAAEVVAALQGHPAKLPEEVTAWVAGKEPPDAALIQRAAEVVRRVLKSSELKDLWADSEESAEWQAEVEGLLRRLASNPPDKVLPQTAGHDSFLECSPHATTAVAQPVRSIAEVLPMQPRTIQSEFAVGDRVWAWWNAPQDDYYVGTVREPGNIIRDAGGKLISMTDYIVDFDDGDEFPVPPDLIHPLTLPAGLQIEFRTPDENRYKPAVVVSEAHDGVIIRLVGGDEIQVSLAAIRIEGRNLPKRA